MLRESFYSISTRILMALARALQLLIVTNALGPDGQGSFGFALSVMTVAAIVGSAGLEISATYHTGKNPENLGSLFLLLIILGNGLGIILSSLTYFILPAFPHYFSIFPTSYLWAIPASIYITILNLFLIAMLVGIRDFKYLFFLNLIQYGLILAPTVALANFRLLTTDALMPIWVFGTLSGSFLASLRIIQIAKNNHNRFAIDWSILKEQLLFGKDAYINNLSNWVNYKLGFFILAGFVSATPLGYYSMSVTIADGLLYLPKGMGTVAIARQAGLGNKSSAQYLYKLYTFVMGAIVLILFVFANWLIPLLFSEAFLPAVPSFRIIILGTWILGLGIIASNHLFGMGESKVPSRGSLLALFLTLLLNLLLIPAYNLIGAALAAAIGYSVYAVYLVLTVIRFNKMSLRDILLPTRDDMEKIHRCFSRLLHCGTD